MPFRHDNRLEIFVIANTHQMIQSEAYSSRWKNEILYKAGSIVKQFDNAVAY